jgi:hypothetical protein
MADLENIQYFCICITCKCIYGAVSSKILNSSGAVHFILQLFAEKNKFPGRIKCELNVFWNLFNIFDNSGSNTRIHIMSTQSHWLPLTDVKYLLFKGNSNKN